jgi:elongator complex protein 3
MFFKGKSRSKGEEFDFAKFKQFFELPGEVGDLKRTEIIHRRLLAIKDKGRTTLEKEQNYNDLKSNIKCVGLTIETRPDYGKLKEGNEMLRLGCTRVEVGIQSVYDSVLKTIERGHTVKDSIESIKNLKDLGFKLNFHYMPGLPGVARKKDLQGMIALFRGEAYRPDMLKIYPCMVVKDSKLYKLWKAGKFRPLTTAQAAEMISEFKRHVPKYCRIMRVQRDIPTYMTEAGVDMTNLRQHIQQMMAKKKIKCECIRCREIGRQKKGKGKLRMKEVHYPASKGNEFFISAEDKEYIYGFCRMRFPHQFLRKEIEDDSALIRELHVYGSAAMIGEKTKGKKNQGKSQHKGIGKALLERAEDIAKTYHRKKMVIISGVGVRGYYRKLGYKREGPYMVKRI